MNNMNVLEKILEEIKERIEKLNMADNMCRENAERNKNFEGVKYFQSLMFATERAKSIIEDIIRSRMDEVNDTNVPSKSGWTPCSERLPEETGYYLVQLSRKLPNEDYADRAVVLYNAEEKEFMCYKKLIKAWQPLPEPYKGEEAARE